MWGVPINLTPIVSSPNSVPEFFLIGVDSQPTSSFDKWKNRGINTLVRSPSGHDVNAWTSAAQVAGLAMIRRPRSGTADDGNVPGLIAWSLGDEPDLKDIPAATTVSEGNALRARHERPVFLNFAGGAILGHQENKDQAYYQEASGGGDWICNDFYPVTGWNKPQWIPEVGEAVDIMREISPSKPQFSYIECSDQNEPFAAHRAATPAEMSAQIWLSVIAGVKGIIYFPIRLGNGIDPFSFDGVSAAGLEAEMIAQNTVLSSLGQVLISERNPPPVMVTSAADLSIGWRLHGGKIYVMAVNKSESTINNVVMTAIGINGANEALVYDEDRTVSINSSGQLTDSFTGYATHIYIV